MTENNDWQLVLYDDSSWRDHLLPLVATRPVSDLRVGVLTLAEKWERRLGKPASFLSKEVFAKKYPRPDASERQFLVVKGNILPDERLVDEVKSIALGECLCSEGEWVACVVDRIEGFDDKVIRNLRNRESRNKLIQICFPEDIFVRNARQISEDFLVLTKDRASFGIAPDNRVYGEYIFVEEGVSFHGVTIDATKGPVYIGAGAVLEPGTYLYGPVSIGAGARVKTGATLYPNVTLGPQCTVCGELNNSVLWGDSSKGHHGYLGCAVLGEGCNLGAGTSNSNLRNDWKPVTLYDYALNAYRPTGLTKCGVVIGDHSMVGIQSILTTGTVIGVGAQIALASVVPRFVADFSWLTDSKSEAYRLDAFLEMLERKQHVKNNGNKIDSLIFEAWYSLVNEIRRKQ